MIAQLLTLRRAAAERGDMNLVAEIDAQLSRLGVVETAIAEGLEQAVPVKRGPGRPRKIPSVQEG